MTTEQIGVPAYRHEDTAEEAPHTTMYCRVRTRFGVRPLNRAQYQMLVQERHGYALFIDGMTQEACCETGPGQWRTARLTPRELGILVEYIESARPLRPRSTRIGGRCLSDVAAAKLFERARAKVDLRLGRYQYRVFRLHKDPLGPRLKAYEFAPPDTLAYCLIVAA